MVIKLKEKLEALSLRRLGKSYGEILQVVPVSKSTLASWLKSVSLSKAQKQRFSEKRRLAALKGAYTMHQQRISTTEEIFREAKAEVSNISHRELWLMGIMLYWAEGSKIKEYTSNQTMIFSNSDPRMIKLFLTWCRICLKLTNEQIKFDIYVHESAYVPGRLKTFWSGVTGFDIDRFGKIYLKKHSIRTNRRKTGDAYYGLLRVVIRRSTNLNRKVSAWIEEVSNQCGVV